MQSRELGQYAAVFVKYLFLKILPYMPELVEFQTMVILDPYSITSNAVGVFGLDFQLLFKSGSSYCEVFANPMGHYA